MRLHSSVSGPRGRLRVLKFGVLGGLLVLLMVSTVACGNAEPPPGSTPTTDGPDVSQSPSSDQAQAQQGPAATGAPTSTSAPEPASRTIPPSPTPIVLTDLKVVEFDSVYTTPWDLSSDQWVNVGRDGEIYLGNLRTGEVRQLTDDGHLKREPVISGNLVAWRDQRREIKTPDYDSTSGQGLADDIFVLDLDTGEQRRITDVPARRSGLQLSGHRLVWNDRRNEAGEHYTHYDVYAYDLEADEEIAMAVAPGAQRSAAIDEDRVVWIDNRNRPKDPTVRPGCFECPGNRRDVYLYDFNTEEVTVLDDSGSNNVMPDISGQRVVWRSFDEEKNTHIHLHDLDTGHRRTLASPKLSGVDRPLVSDDYVVWTVGKACDVVEFPPREVQTCVFTYDLKTDEVRQLSNYIEPSIRLDGNVVVIREGCHVTSRVYAVFLE